MICQRNGAPQINGVADKINLVMDYYPAEQRLVLQTNDVLSRINFLLNKRYLMFY